MKFVQLPRLFPDQPLWGAVSGPFTFVISQDEDGFSASVKIIGAIPNDGSRHDLGGGYCAHKNLADAQEACRAFLKNRDA
jgi:hypothetical protein